MQRVSKAVFTGVATIACSISLQAAPLFSVDFTDAEGFSDGVGISGTADMGAQPFWVAADTAGIGYATTANDWARAENFTSFSMGVGDSVTIVSQIRFNGTATNDLGANWGSIGFAEESVNTGGSTPDVLSFLKGDGSGGYLIGDGSGNNVGISTPDANDWMKVTQTFTRSATLNEYSVSLSVDNLTDAAFVGATAYTATSAGGAWGDGVSLQAAFRTLQAPNQVSLDVDLFSGDLTVIPEPTTFALLGLGGLLLAVRRRLN